MTSPVVNRGQNGSQHIEAVLQTMYSDLRTLPQYTITQLNALSPKSAFKNQLAYVTNGAAGQPCVAICDGTNWKVLAAVGANVS